MVYIVFICCTLPVYECDFMRCMKIALYNIDNCMWFVCIIVYLIVFDWLYNYVFTDLLIVFDVYPCLLWTCCMSANIQFMETGNLLSPDKGDMSGFFWDNPVAPRTVSRRVRRAASHLCPAGVVAGRVWKRLYPSAGSGELRTASVALGELFPRERH